MLKPALQLIYVIWNFHIWVIESFVPAATLVPSALACCADFEPIGSDMLLTSQMG